MHATVRRTAGPAYPQGKQSIQLNQSIKPESYSLSSEMTNVATFNALRTPFLKDQF
jgi:hypothetical protein